MTHHPTSYLSGEPWNAAGATINWREASQRRLGPALVIASASINWHDQPSQPRAVRLDLQITDAARRLVDSKDFGEALERVLDRNEEVLRRLA